MIWLGVAAAVLPVLFTGTDTAGYQKAMAPGVRYRMNMASATSSPWVDSNLWRYQRKPQASYLCDTKGKSVVVAMAEGYATGVKLALQIAPEQQGEYDKMAAFLKQIPDGPVKPWVNFTVSDDGSFQAGEVMNMLSRRSIGYGIGAKGDYALSAKMTNAYEAMQEMREKLGDERRVLRLFGSELTLAVAAREGARVRIHLVNYGQRPVEHLRLRVQGAFREANMKAYLYGGLATKLRDFESGKDYTEFTLESLGAYGVLDLAQ
ncbi:MAG: hypothetical protein JNK48_27510 [Bryobacterales bacterium]|nr:hypothetical protein [Bryobacterales bacterium]